MLVSTIVGFNFTHSSALRNGAPVKQNANVAQSVVLDACCPKPKKNVTAKQNNSGLLVIA